MDGTRLWRCAQLLATHSLLLVEGGSGCASGQLCLSLHSQSGVFAHEKWSVTFQRAAKSDCVWQGLIKALKPLFPTELDKCITDADKQCDTGA